MQQLSSGESRLGGIAQRLSNYLTAEVPQFENRSVVLGHIQRGGAPTSDDRVLAFMYGAQAMNMIRDKQYGKMVTWDGAKLGAVDLMEIVGGIKNVDPENDIVKFARAAEISFGD
jgi:6-phosphofructokinase 1